MSHRCPSVEHVGSAAPTDVSGPSNTRLNVANIAQEKERIVRQIRSEHANLLQDFPLDTYIAYLDGLPQYSPYRYVSPEMLRICESISACGGETTLELYHKFLLITLIERAPERITRKKIPDSIRALYSEAFGRIISELATNHQGFYLYRNDLFLKDLGICRLRLIPAGARLVHESGIPRRLLFCDGLSQFARGLWFFLSKTRGFKPLYEIHVDPRSLGEFNPEGHDRFFLRMADLLELNPHVKGMFGESWFYDPELERVSPRLTYLHKRPVENGAKLFLGWTNEDLIKNAILKSPTRRRLYEERQYRPTGYFMIWPRRALISWGQRSRALAE